MCAYGNLVEKYDFKNPKLQSKTPKSHDLQTNQTIQDPESK
jgi:hypothetical protein